MSWQEEYEERARKWKRFLELGKDPWVNTPRGVKPEPGQKPIPEDPRI